MEWPSSAWRNESEKITVGVVGAGWVVRHYHLPVLEQLPTVQIRYVADLHTEAARKAARACGADPVIVDDPADVPECDVALLAVPVGVRDEYVEVFARRSTPIFAEKPFAPDYESHRRYVDQNPEMACNYMRVSYSGTKQVRTLVESGMFGDLERVEISEGGIVGSTGKGKGHYQTDPELGGGILLETGSHVLSHLVWIFHEYDLSVESAEIQWNAGLDVDVQSEFVATDGDADVPVSFRTTLVEKVPGTAEFVFENARMTYDHGYPSGGISLSPKEEKADVSLPLDDDSRYAESEQQATYIRWVEFLDAITHDESDVAERYTLPDVSRLIAETYDAAGRHPMEGQA